MRFGGNEQHHHPTLSIIINKPIRRKMPNADGMILSKEEESDAEVRREDQDRINEFGRLNARLHEVRDEVYKLKVSDRILFECLSFPTRISHYSLLLLLAISPTKYL